MAESYARYDRVAIALHWAMAIAIIFMLVLGFVMEDLKPLLFRRDAYQFHKSLGLTILALALIRLAWRLMHPAPAYPASMKPWERFAAHASHWGFYGFMIAIPLSGWFIISTSSNKFPTQYFGLFKVPLLDWFGAYTKTAHDLFESMHYWLAIAVIALLVLHIGAALKHHLFERDTVLMRMLPRFLANAIDRRA